MQQLALLRWKETPLRGVSEEVSQRLDILAYALCVSVAWATGMVHRKDLYASQSIGDMGTQTIHSRIPLPQCQPGDQHYDGAGGGKAHCRQCFDDVLHNLVEKQPTSGGFRCQASLN